MSDILTGFNMQGNDPIDDRIVSKSILETLEEYLKRVPVQKRYYGLTFFALDKDNKLRQYTFQTSLIEPTIDDSDDRLDKLQENIDNVDKDLQDHKNDKSIHKTSEEIRSEIVDADIPDSIARAQWVIQSIGVAIENIIAGASTDYDTLKKVQTKIEELRSEMESQLYGDDGSGIFKTLEQVLGFLNQYKDFIVDIPNNFVSKTDIIDNLTTDDATKVLSARQGKILSETLTNYFDSAMQSIRSETDRATNAENRIEAKLDDEITRSTNKDENHDSRLNALEGKSHTQNTDLGTTNSTFQLKYNTGNKIKHESDAISVRNSTDTDYVNFIAKNATFKGDLLVEGKSFVTEAETVEIKDNLLLLNKGEVGSGVTKGMAGLEIDRGTEPNYQIVFDESDNRFKAGEIGDIQCLALRDGDDSMTGGMFTSWDSTTKRLKTTNIIPSDQKISFGDNGDIELKYSLSKMGGVPPATIPVLNIGRKSSNYPHIEFGLPSTHAVVYTDAPNGIYLQNQVLGRTFKRALDNSEVLYHADIINDLTTGGTNKVLSAEQGKLLQNSITSIQGSYLPLSGGTMTGSIIFPNRKGIFGRLTDGTGNIKIAVVNANNNVEIGNSNTPLMLVSNSTDLTHYRDNNTYKIWDNFNLPDPARLGVDQTFTGLNTFTKKTIIGNTVSSQILLDPANEIKYRYSSTEVSRGYTISLGNNNNIREFTFGGYYSASKNEEYAYLSLPGQAWDASTYKFYANSLKVPYKWSIDGPDGNAIIWSQTSEIVNLGRSVGTTKIRSGNTDLIHTKNSTGYIIWDESNLPSPASTTDLSKYALLAGDNTFTGSNTFNKTVSVVGSGTISINPSTGINYKLVSTNASRGYSITLGTADDPHTTIFGSVLTDQEYAYIALPGTGYSTTPYRFLVDQMTVPNVFSFLTKGGVLLLRKDSNGIQLGSGSSNTFVNSSNSDLTHRKYTASSTYTDYKIWDESNLPSPVQTSDLVDYVVKSDLDAYATKSWVGEQNYLTTASLDGYAKTTDLASYLPLAGGTLTGDLVLSNNNYIKGILSTGSHIQILGLNSSNTISVGNGSYNLLLYTGASDISHWKGGTSYKIWDASNVLRPLDYVNGTVGSVTSVYTRNLNLNGTSYPFIGTGTTAITLFAPTTAGTSGQILQSQGAGKAPIWVDGGTGGGVQLSDTNVWTGLNTFQGGLKTSDGTNSYDVWDKNNLKYVARITPSNLGYALSFYTTTAGWRDFDDLCINNLMPNASKTIEQGGAGFVGQYESAYASAEIKDIVTQSIFASGGKNLSNVSTGASFLGNESNAFKSAYIGEVNTNTVKSADGKSLLNFKTDGVYMIANSGTEYKLATLNDVSGGGSSVSLDGDNTWTGVNIFSGTTLVINQYDSGNTEIPSSAKYSISLACGGSYNEYGFGAIRTEDRTKQSYSFVQTPSAFFIFDNSGSLYTTIGNTKYEFWNKQNLAKPIIYNTNSDGDGILYKGDSTSNRIDSLELVGVEPPTNNAVPLSNGGIGGFGNIDNAYAEAYIGDVHANNIIVSKIPVKDSQNYFEITANGMYFYDMENQKKYKLTMEQVS